MASPRLFHRPQGLVAAAPGTPFDGDRTLPMGETSPLTLTPPPREPAALDADMTMPLNAERPPVFDPNSTVSVGPRPVVVKPSSTSTPWRSPPVAAAPVAPADTRTPPAVDFDKTIAVGVVSPLHAAGAPGALAEYIVQPGDSLSRIAEKLYGTSARWAELFSLNRDRIKHPAKVAPGTVLRVPRP